MVQIFDSWASHLSPQDFDVFSGPYIKKVIDSVRATHPSLPIILYISGSGGLLERMAACNPDIISIDQSVDLVDGIKRVGSGFAIQVGGAEGVGGWEGGLERRFCVCMGGGGQGLVWSGALPLQVGGFEVRRPG